MDIKLTITRGKHQELNLTAKTMNELVEKIKDWQDYENYIATVKQFKKQPTEEKLKKEKESGWYYINSVKKLTLTDISQQRELLENYQHFIDWNEEHDRKASKSERIESFIAYNCG
jgi:chloramphenicol O-acetyltransferase